MNGTQVTIKPTRGRVLRFSGVLLGETVYDTRGRDPMRVRLELWETAGANWIAVATTEPAGREGLVICQAAMIEKGELMAMQDAAMDLWNWTPRARSFAKDVLKWRLDRTVP